MRASTAERTPKIAFSVSLEVISKREGRSDLFLRFLAILFTNNITNLLYPNHKIGKKSLSKSSSENRPERETRICESLRMFPSESMARLVEILVSLS